jgi:hypothetical protein
MLNFVLGFGKCVVVVEGKKVCRKSFEGRIGAYKSKL